MDSGSVTQLQVVLGNPGTCGSLRPGFTPDIRYQDSPFGWPGDVPRYSFDTSRMRGAGFVIETTSRQAVRRAADDLALEWPEA